VDEWLDLIPGAKGTLSRKKLLDELIPLVRTKVNNGENFTEDESDQLKRTISDSPLRQFRVLRRIYGVALRSGSAPVQMGDFLVHHGGWVPDQIREHPFFSAMQGREDAEESFIECRVQARDSDKAGDLADVLFYRFELLMRLLIGRRTRSFEVGILNYVGPQMRGRIVLLDDGAPVSLGSSWEGAMERIPINAPFFSNLSAAFARLFELISRKNNELQKHVVRCAEWTGQAMADPNAASALVKAAIALEVMFSANEKGVITPSIMAQIAESCAFLLGCPEASPLEIEREVRRLYGVRSAVVHSGKDSVEEEDLDSLIEICRKVIIVLLSDEELVRIENMVSLSDYFKRRKFAGAHSQMPRSGT
jgi:hypothetical protein